MRSKSRDKILFPPSTIYVLIITALRDELKALKNCDDKGGNSWEEDQDSLGYSYYKKTFKHGDGSSDVNILAASAIEMGENSVNELASRLISELKPDYLAMTGVCAGNKEDVFLGDVIVADRVFKFDHGKLIASYQNIEGKQFRTEEIFHDIRTYNLNPLWKSKIQDFSQDWTDTIQTSRPKSYQHQERWLLHRLYDYQENSQADRHPQQHPDREGQCRDWKKVIERLRQQKLLEGESLTLTETGIKEVKEERLLNLKNERYKDRSIPKVHIGVIGTTSYVQKDPQIFDQLEKLQRKAIGVEMEGAAIGSVAEIRQIRMIIVKSIQDYADYDKNDQFRFYAAETSARFLLAFLTTSNAVLKDKIEAESVGNEIEEAKANPRIDNPLNEAVSSPVNNSLIEFPEKPLLADSPYYVERPDIESRCYQRILSPGEFIRIKASKKMGKTSLLNRILYKAREQEYSTIFIDFGQPEKAIFESLEKVSKWFCAQASNELDQENKVDDLWNDAKGSINTNTTDYFEEYLLGGTRQNNFLLAIDNFDIVFRYPQITDDLCSLFRNWSENSALPTRKGDTWKKLRIVLAYATNGYASWDINRSPLRNIGWLASLEDWKLQEIQDCIQQYGLNLEVRDTKKLMEMIGGHPYLVRKAIQYLYENNSDVESLLEIALQENSPFYKHLQELLWQLEDNPHLRSAYIQILRGNTSQTRDIETSKFQLYSMGLTNSESDNLLPKYKLYSNYFSKQYLKN
jgi:nucleoside phosphorylase